jgi:PPOX class probable F420-dependent enzyme
MARDRGVAMAADAVAEMLDEQRTVTLATIGPDGLPHLAAMWFARDGADLLMWTYGRSQKARNLARDPRATVLAEGGESYDQLRGVCLDCEVARIEDPDETLAVGRRLAGKYQVTPEMDDASREAVDAMLRAQATRRVGLRFTVVRSRTWDHRKLTGG